MSRNLGAGKGTGIEKLFYLPDICFFNRSGSGWMFLLIWRWVLIPVCNRACRDPCGKGTAFHHGLFVCDLSIYGLFHRSLPRNRKSVAPTVIVILGSCVFRVIWVFTIFAHFHTLTSLYLLYAFSWIITGAAEVAYFWRSYRKIAIKNLNHVHERSEAGRGGIPLRKIEVPCSDDVADSRLRIVGQDVRLPKTSVAT